jgi:hypothetical protein
MLRWHRAAVPGMGLADAPIVHQAETLAFVIFEVEPEPTVSLGDTLMGYSDPGEARPSA